MSYLKFKADHIFDGYHIHDSSKVLITKEDGTIVEIIESVDAGDGVRSFKGVLSPAFVNAHCHLELSHLKGKIAEKTGLVNFVQEVMQQRSCNDEEKNTAMINADKEMYNSGIAAVGDICNATDSINIKKNSKIHWHNFIEVSGLTDAFAEKRLNDIKKVAEGFIQNDLFCTLVPHAPYSVSKTLFRLLNNETANQLISIHNQESEEENLLYKNRTGDFLKLYKSLGIDISSFQSTGQTSVQSFLPYFTNKQSIILVHNTFISQEDIDFVKQQTTDDRPQKSGIVHHTSYIQHYFCLCANANKYIEQKTPPIELLLKNSCNIVIGTDSYASNRQLNILDELKTIQQETNRAIPLQEMLQWATLNGAKTLQIEGHFGSFEKNKKPGIVLISNVNDFQLAKASQSERLI